MTVLTTAADLFEYPAQTKAVPVNCVGVMGAGLAAAWRDRYPQGFLAYRKICQAGLRSGKPAMTLTTPLLAFGDSFGDCQWILWPTKFHWSHRSDLGHILQSIEYVGRHLESWDVQSLAVPALGCGLGGLDWGVVGGEILSAFGEYKIPVTICLYDGPIPRSGRPVPRRATLL